jgi:Protein of unknown function (DUF3431)
MHLVIAHCNEDLSFMKMLNLDKYDEIFLYRKNPEWVDFFHAFDHVVRMLPNVGRCDHTYLRHIIDNYDNLADLTIFIPGSCDMDDKFMKLLYTIQYALETDQSFIFHDRLNNLKEDIYNFKMTTYDAAHKNNPKGIKMELCEHRPFGKWWEQVFGDYVYDKICYQGIIAAKKSDIHKRPKEFYETLISYVDKHNNPEAGHYIERSWCAIFQL